VIQKLCNKLIQNFKRGNQDIDYIVRCYSVGDGEVGQVEESEHPLSEEYRKAIAHYLLMNY